MNWFKITLPNALLERYEIAEMASEFYDVLKTFYNDKDHTGALLLCDDPLLKYGSVYASPQTMQFPLLKQYLESFDPVECDIDSVKNLYYLAGDKKYCWI